MMLSESQSYNSIQLVSRDWAILQFLDQQGYSTFEQIKSKFFTTTSACEVTCSRRLGKLTLAGIITKKKLSDFFLEKSTGRKNIPLISNFNIRSNSKIFCLSEKFRKKYSFSDALLKNEMLIHQLLLSELRLQIDNQIKSERMLNDPCIKVLSKYELGRHNEIRPDLSYEGQNFKYAVELERSNKSKSRYYERFLYYENSIYSKAIYYTTNKRNIDYLLKQSRAFEKVAVGFYKEPSILIHNAFGEISLLEFLNKS